MLLCFEILIAKVLLHHNKQLEIIIFFQNLQYFYLKKKLLQSFLEGPLQKGIQIRK